MKGELVPVRSRITPEHGVSYEIYNSNFPLKKGWPIEWDGARWLFERPTSVHVSRKLKQYITPDMFDKNVDASTLSSPDHIGLRYSADNKKYIKVKSHYVEIENRDGFYFIRKNNREPVYLQVEKDKFLLENFQHCIHRLKKYGLGGINLRPSQLISDKLKISEEDAVKLLREYTFPQESTLYTEGTFALWIKNFGNVPDWAADFSKIDFSAYISRFRNGEVINNQLVRFSDSDGYFYRADSTPPEEILSSGFRTSNDYTAIKKMIPEDEVGLIVAGDIEGALRYNSLAKSPYIYKIKANNIRGVSLKDNLMQNHDGLREFLREPLEKKYETLDSLAEDTNGAIYLDEIHLYKSDINVENISIVPKEEMEISLTDGPWKNHF